MSGISEDEEKDKEGEEEATEEGKVAGEQVAKEGGTNGDVMEVPVPAVVAVEAHVEAAV